MQREFKISLSQEFYSDIVYLSQYDSDYPVIFTVTDKYSKASGINGYTAKFTGTRGDGTGLGFTYTATAIGHTVSFTIDTMLTGVAGTHTGEIIFYDQNDLYFGTANVQIIVEPAARPDGTIDADEEELRDLAQQCQDIVDTAAAEVKGEAESWAVGERDGEPVPSTDPTYHNNAKYYAEQAAATVESISDVTDQVATNTSDISDLKEDLNSELKRTYTSPYTPTFNVISGGITINGSDWNNHADRARTQYIPITAGETYYVCLGTTDYTIQRAWVYTTNTSAGAVEELHLIDGQNFVFTADDNINYVRMTFVNSADSSTTITEENRTTIRNAIGIYTKDKTLAETVESHSAGIDGMLDYQTINWKSLPQTTNVNYVLSWRAGFWGNSNNAVNSTTDGAIRYWSWIGKQREAIGANYVEFIPPAVGYIVLKEYETKKTTELLGRYDITKPTIIRLHDTHIYRISVYGLGDDLSPYLTEEFIQTIGIKPIYSVKDTNKAIRTGEFIRFNVKVNNTWSHGTYTDINDHESGEEHDHMCILTLPESYTASGKKTPLIMYCHGASCGITATKWYGNSTGEGPEKDFLSMIRTFTAHGYAVFDVNNTRQVSSGFNDWGCLPLMSAYIKAWEYIKEKYNVSDKLFILSASMGTPAALNMMKWHKSDVLASLILAPRPFGAKGRWDETYDPIADARKKEFLVAWGFEPDSILDDETFVVPSRDSVFTADIDAKLRGFYHYENIVTIGGTDYVFEKYPPMKVMVGLGDTDFLPEVRRFFTALGNFDNYINYRELASQTHGQTCTLANGDLRDEALAWFKRFRYVEPDEDEEA